MGTRIGAGNLARSISRQPRWGIGFGLSFLAILMPNRLAQGVDLSPASVNMAISRGAEYLLKQQRDDGTWSEIAFNEQPGGLTALCTLALLSSGRTPAERPIQKALEKIRGLDADSRTYALSLQIMVLCAAEPRKDLGRLRGLVAQLQSTQVSSGAGKGGWTYGRKALDPDPSNSQYALMALQEAERVGIPVEDRTWKLALEYWQGLQRPDGSWRYRDDQHHPSTGSMTCAGIASLIIAHGELDSGGARWEPSGAIQCCGASAAHDDIEKGFDWLGNHFSVQQNPGGGLTARVGWYYYYLYGLERVGRMSGRRFVGEHDWYREGTNQLLTRQDQLTASWKGENPEGSTVATSFALLFLSKGRRPILVSKWVQTPQTDSDYHPHDIAHLTHYVEKRWQQNLTWQNIDRDKAEAVDLLQSPVLFLVGRDSLDLSPQQKERLRQYVVGGGFLFANACCDGSGFDRDFRKLMEELFPESPLRFLDSDHPVWYAEQPVAEDQIRPLYGLDACCRTSVVYCPEDLSCLWELAQERDWASMPGPVKSKVAAALAIGGNVLAYATNRQLRDKLDQVALPSGDQAHAIPGSLRVAKLQHSGGSHDAISAVGNLLRRMRDYDEVAIQLDTPLYSPADKHLADVPVVFVHGRRAFQWTEEERKALRLYLERGGFLIADAICASKEFTQAFRTEMGHILPEAPLRPLPANHPIFSDKFQGFDVSRVKVRHPIQRLSRDEPLRNQESQEPPTCEGITLGNRLVAVFSPLDLSCAWENHPSLECEGYATDDAVKLGINFVHFALQQ